jgi:hypothetical protein
MPLPMCPKPHSVNPSATDLSGKHRAKSVPPKSNRLMADVDAAFVQKILHIEKRKRETNVNHHGQADDLSARLEVTKGGTFCRPERIGGCPARLKKSSSESAVLRIHTGHFEGGKGYAGLSTHAKSAEICLRPRFCSQLFQPRAPSIQPIKFQAETRRRPTRVASTVLGIGSGVWPPTETGPYSSDSTFLFAAATVPRPQQFSIPLIRFLQ